MEFLGKIGIDPKLLIAQMINFLVLLWVLERFLYKPLRKKLTERVDKAKAIEEGKREIARTKEEMAKKNEEIIQQAREKTKKILEEGKQISEEEKERVLERTEEEVREILREAREKAELSIKLTKEKEEKFIVEKAKKVVEEVLSSSFSRNLHKKYIEDIIEEMKRIDFAKINKNEISSVIIVSAYPLDRFERKKLADFLFSKLRNPAFEEKIDLSLIAGIKVLLDGFTIDGSLKDKIEKAI